MAETSGTRGYRQYFIVEIRLEHHQTIRNPLTVIGADHST